MVVPLVGTWIETKYQPDNRWYNSVVPLVGTWIETSRARFPPTDSLVVPLVGTWIETLKSVSVSGTSKSFPSWERGLKPENKNASR